MFHIFGAWESRPHKVPSPASCLLGLHDSLQIDKKELARVLRSFISMNKQIFEDTYKQDPKHKEVRTWFVVVTQHCAAAQV